MTDQLPDDVLGFIGDIAVGMFTQSHRKQACDLLAKHSPTKEPAGLGAVVRDDNGQTWVRAFLDSETPWYCVFMRQFDKPWDRIPQPVEILSAGVAL